MRKIIFVVDDCDTNLASAEDCLEDFYEVITLPSGSRLFEMLTKMRPHLILLDIDMPEMDGFEALHLLKTNKEYSPIPVVFLTGSGDVHMESKGFESGAVDFISKPFVAPVLLNRIKTHIDVSELIKERTAKLEKAHRNLILILADMVENRDKSTGGHIERTREYIRVLILEMISQGVYIDELNTWDLDMMCICAILHDVGKIGVSDNILNKSGKLSDSEYGDMKAHTLNGASIINKVIERTGEDDFLHNAKLFAEYHHENWDGSGYPHSLAGEDIPLPGRIMAVADVYDALISERPYKSAMTDDEAAEIILAEAGKRFDPNIIQVFSTIRDKFKTIHLNFQKSGVE